MENFSLLRKCLIFLRKNRILFAILLISFFFSLGYSFFYRIVPAVDARAYDMIAWNLAQGHGYRENLTVDIQHDYAIARVGPLYEFFIAGLYKIFGHYYESVWIVQAILHALTAWLVYLTAVLIFKEREDKKKIALWAALFVGFYPDLIEISAMLLSETLYLFLVCLMVYIYFIFLHYLNGNIKNKNIYYFSVILGIVSGLAILARPPILLFVPVILFVFYRKKIILPGLIFLVCFGALFMPWTIRNYLVYHQFMPLGVAGAYNLWIGNHVGATGEQEPHQASLDFMATHKIYELQGESASQFRSFVFSHPFNFIELCLSRTLKYFSVIRPIGFWFYQTGLGQFIFLCVSGLSSVILFIFGLAGIISSFSLKNNSLRYLLAFVVITPIAVIISVVETRYRFQIYPLLTIFAGFFLCQTNIKKWFKNEILWRSAFIVMSIGLVDLILSADRFIERIGWFI